MWTGEPGTKTQGYWERIKPWQTGKVPWPHPSFPFGRLNKDLRPELTVHTTGTQVGGVGGFVFLDLGGKACCPCKGHSDPQMGLSLCSAYQSLHRTETEQIQMNNDVKKRDLVASGSH